MKSLFILLIFVSTISFSYSENIERRIERLEKKVIDLEKRINQLEKNKEKTEKRKEKSSKISDLILMSKKQNLIHYEVLSKKFKPLGLKESLWQRSDLIILKMTFKNNTNKEISNISGKVVVFDADGTKLMEKKININKALNFFKGTTIVPGETVKMTVELEYDENKKEHKIVKNKPLNELVIKFFPIKIEFADGTVKYINYED